LAASQTNQTAIAAQLWFDGMVLYLRYCSLQSIFSIRVTAAAMTQQFLRGIIELSGFFIYHQ